MRSDCCYIWDILGGSDQSSGDLNGRVVGEGLWEWDGRGGRGEGDVSLVVAVGGVVV